MYLFGKSIFTREKYQRCLVRQSKVFDDMEIHLLLMFDEIILAEFRNSDGRALH